MKLVIATPSPFARKVRVVLREKEIDFEEIIDVPWNRDTICTNYNPLGKIPVLLREGKQPLFDSSIIVQHIECMNKPPAMYPSGLEDAMLAKIIETTADGICDALVLISLENTRKEKLRSKDWIKRQSEKIYNGIEYLSNKAENKGQIGAAINAEYRSGQMANMFVNQTEVKDAIQSYPAMGELWGLDDNWYDSTLIGQTTNSNAPLGFNPQTGQELSLNPATIFTAGTQLWEQFVGDIKRNGKTISEYCCESWSNGPIKGKGGPGPEEVEALMEEAA